MRDQEVEKMLEKLRRFKRRKCAEIGRACVTCPKKYGNLCFAASLKNEICLN